MEHSRKNGDRDMTVIIYECPKRKQERKEKKGREKVTFFFFFKIK